MDNKCKGALIKKEMYFASGIIKHQQIKNTIKQLTKSLIEMVEPSANGIGIEMFNMRSGNK